jgi:hypothetical protein
MEATEGRKPGALLGGILRSNRKELAMPTYDKSLTTAQYRALLTGVAKACPTTTFNIGGITVTATDLEARITAILAAADAVAVAKATWLESIQTAASLETEDGKLVKDARSVIAVMFKNDPVTLVELGIEPKQPVQKLSADARLAATAKLNATRKARGTTSEKQRLKIKGNVTAVVVAPVTSSDDPPQ